MRMATEEHKYLADIIKKTHATLRSEAQSLGPKVAWERHVTREDVLEKYAVSMQRLATTYWAENNSNSSDGVRCRMDWVKAQCKEYFLDNGEEKYNEREGTIYTKIQEHSIDSNQDLDGTNKESNCLENSVREDRIIGGKIKLLDVGSCYNPFQAEEMFEVTAIDLHGVPGRVFQCDFLSVPTGNDQIISDDERVLQLKGNSFDVIVFALLLEYLPCPKLRFTCCQKAYSLLRPGGLLLVITPDSKHVNANVRYMKSWRYLLSKLGFMRIKYEKLRHVHCLAFRKCASKIVAARWAAMQNFPKDDPLFATEDSIFIPQDFRVFETDHEKTSKKIQYDQNDLISVFNELPLEND